MSWKDLFDTAGTATEAGSALLAGRVPERDAAVLATATRAGLVCLGKTHMTELAFSGLGRQPGRPRRRRTSTTPSSRPAAPPRAPPPRSPSASPPAAIGSDTGGSVRVPAAWNDLVGLKTTPRRAAARRRRAALPALRHRRAALPLGRGRGAAPRRARRAARRPTSPARRLDGAAPPRARGPGARADRATRRGRPSRRRSTRLGGRRRRDRARGARPRRRRRLRARALPVRRPRPTASGATTIEAQPEAMFAAGPRALPRRRAPSPPPTSSPPGAGSTRTAPPGAAATAGYDAVLMPTTANLPPERRAPAGRPGVLRRREPAGAAQHPRRQPAGPLRPDAADRRAELRPDGDGGPPAPRRGCSGSARRWSGRWHSAPQNAGPRGACRLHSPANGAPRDPGDEA